MKSPAAIPRARFCVVAAALLVVLGGCGFFYGLAGYPPEVTRSTPPPGIDKRSRPTAAQAPKIRAPATLPNAGDVWERQPKTITVVVFYRGHW